MTTQPTCAAIQPTGRYLLSVGVPLAVLLGVLYADKTLPGDARIEPHLLPMLRVPMPDLLLLLLRLAVVVSVARGMGKLFSRFGQPHVVGEMIAGLLLGPTFFGSLAPDLFNHLFPGPSLGFLNAISQLGLLIFMFLVGLELDPAHFEQRKTSVLLISHVSIVLPVALGTLMAYAMYPHLSSPSAPFMHFGLFMGAAMSVTAFPVLARSLVERNMINTRVGAITLACAAVDDVTAWTMLAGVMALIRTSDTVGHLAWTIGGAAMFTMVMMSGARPLLAYWGRIRGDANLSYGELSAVIVFVFVAASITEWLGIHALFGAFLAGATIPETPVMTRCLTGKLDGITVALLLPLFFAFTGLCTSIGLIDSWRLWGVVALIILTAVAGKLDGSAIAARATGMSWHDAWAVDIFMNTRGRMELIILNVGLDAGVISPAVFAMMLIMVLATTFMTTPCYTGFCLMRNNLE
jgi:Kef-type K+ transport system membrane component KefB